uniref:DAZ domain-containing protein n=1 Tax=Pavo cristatus TaxID=9049 RepID=A0A8C9FTG7_PAVCR
MEVKYGLLKVKLTTHLTDSPISVHGKRLKLGPAIRKQQNLCSYVQPRPLAFNPPAPQFHSVWSNQNTETYVQPQAVVSPLTQYVQTYAYSSPALLIQQQVPVGYQPAYNYQAPPQWVPGEQRNYVMPPVYTSVNYHYSEDPEFIQTECAAPEPTQSSGNSPQKKSVDRSIQTVVSCLFNPENRLRNTFVSQEDYFRVRSESKTKSLKPADLNFVHIQDTIQTKIYLCLLEVFLYVH